MTRTARFVVLCVVLGVCVLNAVSAIFTGKQPPEALYGVLGTIGAYVLLREGKDDNKPPDNDRRDDNDT